MDPTAIAAAAVSLQVDDFRRTLAVGLACMTLPSDVNLPLTEAAGLVMLSAAVAARIDRGRAETNLIGALSLALEEEGIKVGEVSRL